MNVENKPETVTDPSPTPTTSNEQVIQERMAEGRQEMAGVSNLVPPSQTGGSTDVSTQGGSSIVGNTEADVLKIIEASTGRKFASVEEFKKNYTNLNSLVGDQSIAEVRKTAEILKGWETKFGKAAPELEKALTDLAIATVQTEQPKAQPVVEKSQSTEVKTEVKIDPEFASRLDKLEHESQVSSLKEKYPAAASLVKEISAIAKDQNISYIEAFENSPLKSLVELKQKDESQKSPVVTPSNRTNTDFKKLENLGMKIISGKASQSDQVELTREFLKSRGISVK